MNAVMDGSVLYAVRAADVLTAAAAVAWFAPGIRPGRGVIGYILSARAATWIRVRPDGTVETASAADDPLREAYEMVLFDGDRELRWLHSSAGRGPAVALGEDQTALPAGTAVSADPPPRRGDIHTRLLAGVPRPHSKAGWTTLDRSRQRYAPAHLPWTFTDGDLLAVEFVEYHAEDEDGNLDVVEARTIGLRATTLTEVRTVTAATKTSQEMTTA